MIYYFLLFMCDTLQCIHVYFHALNYIRVIVIFMWYVWYLCNMCHVCSLLWSLYMSCHFIMLIWFASAFYSNSNELYFLYSCLFHIYWVHHVGLGHISLPNSFVLSVKSWYEPSMLTTSSLFTYSRLYCHQSPKRERLKASRQLVGFQWLMTIRDYYD